MPRKPKRKVDTWEGCYSKHWKGLVAESAMRHPAKFSRALIDRIYRHYREQGWLTAGDSVLDPFGGVALGALDAVCKGINWTGIELEQEFVSAGNEDIALWDKRYAKLFAPYGKATLLLGDSRHIIALLAGSDLDAAVSSPPFLQAAGGTNVTSKRGPLSDAELIKHHAAGNAAAHGYGVRTGQVQKLKEGSFAAVIASPPFASSLQRGLGDSLKADLARRGKNMAQSANRGYGATAGNVGEAKEGDFKATISSPPFANQADFAGGDIDRKGKGGKSTKRKEYKEYLDKNSLPESSATVETFWEACYIIVAQTYAALSSGAHATWICKDYVRKGAIVPFSDRWRQLCERVGFVTVHEHHAMLVRDEGTQVGAEALGAEDVRHVHERKSFFKRAAENKGAPRIDWEVVYCMRKP